MKSSHDCSGHNLIRFLKGKLVENGDTTIPRSGNWVDQDPLLEPGTDLGKYEIVKFLARGGMGAVYLVRHKVLHSQHAIKIILKAYAQEERFVSRFRHEARIMAALDHPRIVRVTDFGNDQGMYYYVMDYVEGPGDKPRTLENELNDFRVGGKSKGLPERYVKNVALQICDALAYAHNVGDEGVAHLDLKPSNILIILSQAQTNAGISIKITDFGLAKILDREGVLNALVKSQSSTGNETELGGGTPRYMSPEQWNLEGEPGPASDIYSLGKIVYEMLTGMMPQDLYRPPPPSESKCSPQWDAIVSRCLEHDPKRRYRSADRLAESLAKIQFGKAVRKKKRSKVPALFLTALVLAGIGSILAYFDVIDTSMLENKARQVSEHKAFSKGNRARLKSYFKPKGQLKIMTDPDVMILVRSDDGWIEDLGSSGPNGHLEPVTLPEGIYNVEMSLEGYATVMERTEIVEGEQVTIKYFLKPYAGKLLIDNQEKRKKLEFFEQIGALGPPPDETKSVAKLPEKKPPFRPIKPGQIRILSNVMDANIIRKGQVIGKAGDLITLSVGEGHSLELRASGYKPKRIVVLLDKPGERHPNREITLIPLGPTLRIRAIAPQDYWETVNTELWIDGKNLGSYRLPLEWEKSLAGNHTVQLKGWPWKPSAEKRINLIEGKRSDMTFNLELLDSYLLFKVSPSHANIYVGRDKITDSLVKVKPNRSINIRISARHYQAYDKEIRADIGSTNLIEVTLQKARRK